VFAVEVDSVVPFVVVVIVVVVGVVLPPVWGTEIYFTSFITRRNWSRTTA